MKKILATVLIASAALLIHSGQTQAGPFTTALFPGINDLHDQDTEVALNSSGGILSTGSALAAGDYLSAVFQVENINGNGGTSTNFLGSATANIATGVSLLRIVSVVDTGTKINGVEIYHYTFAAPTGAAWASLPTAVTGVANGTVVQIFNNPTNTNPNGATTFAAAIARAISGGSSNYAWSFGFTGTTGSDASGSFVNPNAALGEGWTVSDTANTFAGLETLFASHNSPTFNGGLSLIASGPLGAPFTLGPTTDFFGATFNGIPPIFLVEGDLNKGSSAIPNSVGSGTDAFINLVPEPSSWALLLLGGGVLLGAAKFRSRLGGVAAA